MTAFFIAETFSTIENWGVSNNFSSISQLQLFFCCWKNSVHLTKIAITWSILLFFSIFFSSWSKVYAQSLVAKRVKNVQKDNIHITWHDILSEKGPWILLWVSCTHMSSSQVCPLSKVYGKVNASPLKGWFKRNKTKVLSVQLWKTLSFVKFVVEGGGWGLNFRFKFIDLREAYIPNLGPGYA